MFIKWCDCFVKSSNHHECCVCSYPNQNECITSGDGETTPDDEVCTLQCILVAIYMCLAWKCIHTYLYFLQLTPSTNITSVDVGKEVCYVQPI